MRRKGTLQTKEIWRVRTSGFMGNWYLLSLRGHQIADGGPPAANHWLGGGVPQCTIAKPALKTGSALLVSQLELPGGSQLISRGARTPICTPYMLPLSGFLAQFFYCPSIVTSLCLSFLLWETRMMILSGLPVKIT